MIAKYGQRACHIIQAQRLTGSSKTWRRMLQWQEFMEKSSQMLIREDGSSFWFDNWVDSGPLMIGRTAIPCPKVLLKNCLVKGNWNLRRVEGALSPGELHSVLSSQISLTVGKDILAWCPSQNGVFSISSAIRGLSRQGIAWISH